MAALPGPVLTLGRRLRAHRRRQQVGRALAKKAAALPAGPKVVYALTPPPHLSNVGDQAQAVAIYRWLARHFADRPVLEIDKDEATHGQSVLRRLIGPDDLVLLHSGGNLGDRGIWSETARRLLIANFPGNEIVSMPQTIFFSETPVGTAERRRSAEIYGSHPRLTVIGRDRVSGDLAAMLFPGARTFTMPDPVLMLTLEDLGIAAPVPSRGSLLACLRMDNESVFGEAERAALADGLGEPVTRYDTTLSRPIPPDRREAELAATLSLFAGHEAVVTDRYHGLIFSVIARRPTVVLPTVDHKLTSAIEWFADLPHVRMASHPEQVPGLLAAVRASPERPLPDFKALHFDRIPERIWGADGPPPAAARVA